MTKPDWNEVGPELLKAAQQAAALITALYQFAETADAVSIPGIARCNAMLESMKKNRARTEALVMEPIRDAIAKAKEAAQ